MRLLTRLCLTVIGYKASWDKDNRIIHFLSFLLADFVIGQLIRLGDQLDWFKMCFNREIHLSKDVWQLSFVDTGVFQLTFHRVRVTTFLSHSQPCV